MNPDGTDYGRDYARLPEDLLAGLLREAPRVAEQVHALLGPALAMRTEMRDAALGDGLLRDMALGPTVSSCAVDGGFAVERTVAVDIVLAVAVGVGLRPAGAAVRVGGQPAHVRLPRPRPRRRQRAPGTRHDDRAGARRARPGAARDPRL